ncbi:MAG: hypothetical protein V3V01_00075, partial [Acidimicrobiales bacterium]
MLDVIAASNLLAAIEFRPQIAGVLVVLVGIIVLMGSIWLLLTTNTGIRLGSLIALASIFGWMFIMSAVWWVYGIGYAGSSPVWVTNDINKGDLQDSSLTEARVLAGVENLDFSAYDLVLSGDSPEATAEYTSSAVLVDSVDVSNTIRDQVTEDMFGDALFENLAVSDQERVVARSREVTLAALSPEALSALEASFDSFSSDRQVRNQTVTFSELASVAPDLIEDADFVPGDWRLLSSATAGEAQAQASADVLSADVFGSAAEFKFLDAYDRGGKPKRTDNGIWGRVSHKVGSIVNFRHPVHHAVVRLQQVVEVEPVAGEAPPRPTVDQEQPV